MSLFTKKQANRIVPKTIFPIRDWNAAKAFYERAGFSVEEFNGDYAFVIHAGDEILHLRRVDKPTSETSESAVYFHVPSSDQWHADWLDAGIEVSAIVDEAHGMREFSVRDPSGNLIRVGHNL